MYYRGRKKGLKHSLVKLKMMYMLYFMAELDSSGSLIGNNKKITLLIRWNSLVDNTEQALN